MTPGTSEAQAAAGFLATHSEALRAAEHSGDLELRESWSLPAMDGSFVAYGYQQFYHGREVEGSDIRVIVKRGTLNRVTFAAARLAGTPTSGSEYPVMPSEAARMIVQTQSGFENLTIESPPEVVVLLGSNRRPDAWVWRVRARDGESRFPLRRTFFVDTVSPRIVKRDDLFSHLGPPTTGSVSALGMPIESPLYPYRNNSNDLVTHTIPGIRVTGQSGGNSGFTYTNVAGNFTLNVGSSSQSITLSSTFSTNAQWYKVEDLGTVDPPPPPHYLASSVGTAVGDDVSLALADSSWEEQFRVAQVDTVITAHRSRTFFVQYLSATAAGLARRVYIYSNAPSGVSYCNALAADDGTNYLMAFPRAGGGCWNNGNHSAAAHEYGHIALYMLHSGFPISTGFHEGFADTFGNLVNDDSVQGRAVRTNGGNLRDSPIENWVNCQYGAPDTAYCGCLPHKGAPLLSGPWLRITNDLKSYYGTTTGLERSRSLLGLWTLATVGGDGAQDCDNPHAGNLAELLGLPQTETEQQAEAEWDIFCRAFGAHNMYVESGCP